MNVKQWSAWLLAAGITTLISAVSIPQSGEQIDTNNTRIILANMTKAQKDSVIKAEIANVKTGDEIKSMRGKSTKHFKGEDGKFLSVISTQQKHYFDDTDSVYKEIDLTVHEISDLAKQNPFRTHDKYIDAGPYTATWYDDKPWNYEFFSKDNEYYVRYLAQFSLNNIDIITEYRNDGAKQSIVLLNNEADTTFSWVLETNAEITVDNGSLVFRDSENNFLFCIPKPFALDADYEFLPVDVHFSNKVLTYSMTILQNSVYPIILDPSTVYSQTAANTGNISNMETTSYLNARNSTTGDNSGTGDLWVGNQSDGSTFWRVYRGFLEIDTSGLPDDAVIDSAKIVCRFSWDDSETDFGMRFVNGTGSGALSVAHFNDFTGWAPSGTYNVTNFSNIINTANISLNDTLRFKLTSAGVSDINKTGVSNYVLLSTEDINASAPTNDERCTVQGSFLKVWYQPLPSAPSNFTMDNPSKTSITAHYTRVHSENVDSVAIANASDSSLVKYYDSVTDTITTVTGLSPNTEYSWLAYVDSAGVKSYSNNDNLYTIIDPPGIDDITIIPISSDTLRISATEPPNPTTGLTGMQVEAVSGSGATSSGWLDGQYSYLDGGLNPDSTYVYKVRYRNGDGAATAYSPEITYEMNGVRSIVIDLKSDLFDDYNVDFGSGRHDSTDVRVGTSDSGERLDGFLSFSLPWQIVNGGVDSMFLTMTRAEEESLRTPSITIFGIPVKFGSPIEERTLGSQDSTSATVDWTIDSGTGNKTSPNLRTIFNEWREITSLKDFLYDFGLRLDDNSQVTGDRAVMLDYSHPSYSNGTKLTIYYTPGIHDSLEGAPENFSLNVLSPDSIRATWTDNSDSEYGFVILNLADSTLATGTDSLAQNTTSVDLGGLTPNTLYEWFVRAYTADDDSSSSSANARSLARPPGTTTTLSISSSSISFVINPQDNPAYTEFAVQDSITGLYVDGSAEPETLRAGTLGDWGWKTYSQWGSSQGDTITGLQPDSLYVIRAKAKTGE